MQPPFLPTVPALPGTPVHGAPAGPRLHRPAGQRLPAPRAAARACPGQLPPPLPAPPPGRLPRALQPGPLSAPARLAAPAKPGLVRVPGCPHAGEGLGLRTIPVSPWTCSPRVFCRDPRARGNPVLAPPRLPQGILLASHFPTFDFGTSGLGPKHPPLSPPTTPGTRKPGKSLPSLFWGGGGAVITHQ